jgi:predicted phage terminase large subunit-like protein|nr:MAG TPA: Terminase [Caudoviricetes sp.]
MQPKQCIAIIDSIKAYAKQNPTEAQVYEDWFQAVVNLRDALSQDKRFNAYKYSGELRSVCAAMMGKMKTGEDVAKAYDIISRTYLFEAKDVFDSYCIYLEWNRAPEKKFYQPRRKVLLTLVRDLEDLFFHRVEFLGVSQPPRTGKSTLCIFFITWLMGNRPDVASVMSGHSDKLTNGFYGEVLSIITDPVTYNWGKIFPDVQLVDKSAKDESVDLNRKKRFPTLTCRSIGGTLTGAVEIGEGGVLYSDDLIEDLEESLNVERLNNKYDAYLNQLKDRKKQGALELMVGTRWNVLDPLGRIQNQYADNPKYRFRVIPAVDENGHSNFNYDYGVGFDDAYYADMKASIDDATWWAKYMGKPYVREGLLFPADELRYFNGVLPDGEPDRKLMVMDIAWGGGDFTACPIAYVYGDAVFIPDLVFNNGDKTVTRPEVVGKIIQHKINVVRGEANNGGDEYCDVVDGQLRQQGYHCSVRSQRAPSGQSKLSRIIQYAPDIKRFYFLDEKHQSKEYKAFMEQVTMFTQLGKVPHDDAPDSLAQLADELYNGISKIEPVKRPF